MIARLSEIMAVIISIKLMPILLPFSSTATMPTGPDTCSLAVLVSPLDKLVMAFHKPLKVSSVNCFIRPPATTGADHVERCSSMPSSLEMLEIPSKPLPSFLEFNFATIFCCCPSLLTTTVIFWPGFLPTASPTLVGL